MPPSRKRRTIDSVEEDSARSGRSTNRAAIVQQDLENTIRILIASDNHIGYLERDAVRGNDSYDSFREVLEIAKAEDVDMVLLAGDLFHENKPSRKAMYQAMRSLRLNCLGDKPCELEVLGDQSVATEDAAVMHINYEDQDINVAIPVFSIHGNHDDPSGEGRLCALDILQVAGLLNYFGRVPESDDITVKPVLLQKGTTKLALYGISNVRDERLHRSFRHNKVRFMRPELYQDEWFNLIAVHQNHHGHSETNYLPENFIQNFFDFVVWGHEHECVIDPVLNPEQDFHVCQPGSSVATSLCAAEAIPKRVGVLSIRDREFKMKTIPLKTVRPYIFKEISLSDVDEIDPKIKNKTDVIAYLMDQVEQAILEANEQWHESHQEEEESDGPGAPLPLIRLRVDYSTTAGAYELENPQRFSQRFLGRVANANDVVQFHMKKKPITRKTKNGATTMEVPDLSDVGLTGLRVSALVKQFLSKQTLQCLPENELGDAVAQFVEKDDRDAVKDFVDDHLDAQVRMMTTNKTTTESNLNEAIERTKSTLADQFQARQEVFAQKRRAKEAAQVSDFESDGDSARRPATSAPAAKKAAVSRKRKAASPPATTRKAPAKRKAPARKTARDESEEDDDDDEPIVSDDYDEEEETAAPAPKARAKAAAKAVPKPRAAARKPPARQSQLTFTSTPASNTRSEKKTQAIDISSGESDDFEPVAKKRR